MKSSVEVVLIAVAAVGAGFATWAASGRPSGDPAVELRETPLREGEVRLETLREQGIEGILWIDARKRPAWEEDGLEGSIHLSMVADAPLGAQIEQHFEALSAATRVVIYCDDIHCSLSHDLAEKLRGEYAGLVPGEILVLQGGVTALRAGGMLTGSSSGS